MSDENCRTCFDYFESLALFWLSFSAAAQIEAMAGVNRLITAGQL